MNPNGSETTCVFRYGKNRNYGSAAPASHPGGGTSTIEVSARINNLAPGTKYHYELNCANAGGDAAGGDRTFTTKNSPGIGGSANVTVASNGTLTIRVTCQSNSRCVGALSLTTPGGKSLASPVRYSIRAHKSAKAKLRLKKSALKTLRRKHQMRARLTARNRDGSKASRIVTLRITKARHH